MAVLRRPRGSTGSLWDAGTLNGARTSYGSSTSAHYVAGRLIAAIDSLLHEATTFWSALLDEQPTSPATPPGLILEDLDTRLAELATLENGWMDGEGVAPGEDVIVRARQVLTSATEFVLPRPQIFPTLEGGIQAEWSSGRIEMSITFEPNSDVLDAIAVNTETGASSEQTIPANRPDLLSEFVRFPHV